MKWVLRILGVVALLVATLSLMASTTIANGDDDDDDNDDDQLVVDGRVTFNTGPSPELPAGASGYASGDVSAEGQLGLDPLIGDFATSFISSDPGGVGLSIGHTVWHIDGEGDIWVVREFDFVATPQLQGIIIGGTGRFAGATGEYSANLVACCDPIVSRATFTFDD